MDRACQQAAARRAELRVVATAPAVLRLLAAKGLDRLVPVYSSVEAAAAAGEPGEPGRPGDPASPIVAPRRPSRPREVQENGPRQASLTEAVLRQLIDALADGIVLADEDGRIVLASRRAAEMVGYQSVVGFHLAFRREFDMTPGDYRRAASSPVATKVAT